MSVPVLSKITSVTAQARSSTAASRTRIPRAAARPAPTMIAVGVASPNAQGQATTSTAIVAERPKSQLPASSPQLSSVAAAITSTTGTK